MSEDTDRVIRLREASARYRERHREKERERQRIVKQKKREQDREAYNAYMREYNAKKGNDINAKKRERRANDPEYARKLREAERANKTPEKVRATRLKRQYGLSLADYAKMYSAQDGKCAICGTEKQSGGRNGLAVDHCHESGKVRKLLCSPCNTALGKFKDSTEHMLRAVEYLLSFRD